MACRAIETAVVEDVQKLVRALYLHLLVPDDLHSSLLVGTNEHLLRRRLVVLQKIADSVAVNLEEAHPDHHRVVGVFAFDGLFLLEHLLDDTRHNSVVPPRCSHCVCLSRARLPVRKNYS